MEEFLNSILTKIVSNPDSIKLERGEDDMGKIITIHLADEDKPLVIGKGGRNIQAIRTIASIVSKREGEKVFIKIAD